MTNKKDPAYIAGMALAIGFILALKKRGLSFDANINNPNWVTTENGHHFLIDEEGDIQSGRFKGRPIDGLKSHWQKENGEKQGSVRWDSPKNRAKRLEMVSYALKKIDAGASHVVIPHLRNDLQYYGGVNNVTIPKGVVKPHHKGYGLLHIADKHGESAVKQVLEAVANGDIKRFDKSKKTVCLQLNGYEAVLSLMEGKRQKTWVLTGYDIIE